MKIKFLKLGILICWVYAGTLHAGPSIPKRMLKPSKGTMQLSQRLTQNIERLSVQTKEFVARTGHRPRALISDENGIRLRVTQMTPEQLEEHRLGNRLGHLFNETGIDQIKTNPALRELYELVQNHPNQKLTVSDGSYYRQRARDLYIDEVLKDTRQYLQTYHALPRMQIFRDKMIINKEDQTPQEQFEIALARRIYRVLRYSFQDPRIDQLRELVESYTNKPTQTAPVKEEEP